MKVSIKVNGTLYEREVEPRMLLVHFLREELGLTGTNVGCDTSQCGACNVHLNGQVVKSCTCLAAQADGGERRCRLLRGQPTARPATGGDRSARPA